MLATCSYLLVLVFLYIFQKLAVRVPCLPSHLIGNLRCSQGCSIPGQLDGILASQSSQQHQRARRRPRPEDLAIKAAAEAITRAERTRNHSIVFFVPPLLFLALGVSEFKNRSQ